MLQDIDAVIIGAYYGQAHQAGMVSLSAACHDAQHVCMRAISILA